MHVFLETDRLILRRFTLEDASSLYELDLDPEVRRFVSADPPDSLPFVGSTVLPILMHFYEMYPAYGCWPAIEKSSNEFIGWFHFRPAHDPPGDIELGYRLRQSSWGKGYATEGSRALVRHGFNVLGLERVIARALIHNRASRHVMDKLGFMYQYSFIEKRFSGPDKRAVQYELKRPDFIDDASHRTSIPGNDSPT